MTGVVVAAACADTPADAHTACTWFACAPGAPRRLARGRRGAAGHGAAADRPPSLVVLPAVSWQGLNRWTTRTSTASPDTLESRSSRAPVASLRRRPAALRFAAEVSPLLRFLDRERLAYDITTDLALARRQGPRSATRPAWRSPAPPAGFRDACATASARR